MLDSRAHVAALDAFREQLALTDFADPQVAALRDQQVADADQSQAAADLGSLIDQLLWHASSDGVELELLERASKLWQDGRTLYTTLADFRANLEAVLADPSDAAALQGFNAAVAAMKPLMAKVLDQDADIKAMQRDVAKMPHLPPHPRQEDLPIQDWSWGNIFLARRTDAFARAMRQLANDTDTSAFALGVLSSYGANVAGAAYLGQVTGGPRRGHRHRNRLARNTVGSWVARQTPGFRSLTALADQLDQAFPEGLPEPLERQIQEGLAATYDPNRTPPPPDLKLGFRRLLRQLRLLDGFTLPDAPVPPREPFLGKLYGDPANPYTPSMPEGTGLREAGDNNAGPGSNPGSIMPQNFGQDDGPDHSEPPPSTEAKCGAFWEALGWSFLFLLGGWIACVIRWQDGGRCPLWDDITQNWEAAFPDGAYGAVESTGGAGGALTADSAATIAQNDQIVQFIGDLSNLQDLTWEGFQKARDFLALFGLIYPDGLLDRWRYSQYLRVPSFEPGDWPRLPETGERFDEYPETGVELPAVFSFAYGPGASPAAVLAQVPNANSTSGADVSLMVWTQLANGVLDAQNLDLDADRGWRHPCWVADGSITDQPIAVLDLGYDET